MNLSLDPKVMKLIEERVKSGQYASAEDVVAAALVTLDQGERLGDFDKGELDELLAEGEQGLEQEGASDAVFRARRARRARKRNQSS